MSGPNSGAGPRSCYRTDHRPRHPAGATTEETATTLMCPKCAVLGGIIRLDLDDAETFSCDDCDETFTADDVRDLVDAARGWERMLAWVEKCPARAADGKAEAA